MKLFFKKYGEKGRDLVIIHGLFGMSDNWNTLGKKFSQNFKVHLIDLRNHGRSPHSNEFNFHVMSEDLLEYIEDHQIIDPIILGHSLGGKVAMKFAFTYPEKINKLIIVDISPRKYDTEFHQNILKILYKLPLENFNSRSEIDKTLSISVENQVLRSFLMKNLFRNEDKKFEWRFNINVLLDKLICIQEADFIIGICSLPTCFIRGGNSNYINKNDELIINKHFSNVKIKTIEGSGHWLHADNSEKFYLEVMSFI